MQTIATKHLLMEILANAIRPAWSVPESTTVSLFLINNMTPPDDQVPILQIICYFWNFLLNACNCLGRSHVKLLYEDHIMGIIF
jgi:hypothetical protein